jgi:hypothetical protein
MTISEVVAAFGAYYLSHGQNQNDIYSQLKRGFVTEQAFTHIITDDTVWRASEARHTRIVQPFQRAFTPTGTAEFKPREIRQYNLKADLLEYPDDIKSSWLGFLSSTNVKRADWPFIKYWMEKQVVPQIQQDMELNEVGRGVYAAPTSGTAGPAGTAMNGILKILADHITAGDINPVVLGAVPTDDAELVEYYEAFHDAIPIQYRSIPMTIYAPESHVLRYKRGYEKKYGLLTNIDTKASDGMTRIRFSNIDIVGLPSLNLKANGSPNDRFFMTQKSNAIMLTKGLQNSKGIFDIQPFDRSVKLLTDWWMGVGFIIPQIVWVNDGAA